MKNRMRIIPYSFHRRLTLSRKRENNTRKILFQLFMIMFPTFLFGQQYLAAFFASKIDTCASVGFPEYNDKSKRFHVFPNPASTGFSIQITGEFKIGNYIEVLDINGSTQFGYTVEQNTMAYRFTQPFQYLATGVYFIRIKGKDFIETQKVVISSGI